MRLFLTFIAFCFFAKTNAQFNDSTFEVTKSDLETNFYEKDSISKSVVIYEDGNSFIHHKTYNLITEVRRKIKILDKNDNNQITVKLLLYNSDTKGREETLRNLEAYTYNLQNGSIIKTKLKESDIFVEVYNKNYKLVKFALPNTKNGSVITYSYTLDNPFTYKYSPWSFQDEVPVLYSKYKTSIPGTYDYHIKRVGYKDFDSMESKVVRNCLESNFESQRHCQETTYTMKNLPAFVEEDYMTTKENYLSRIEYELKEVHKFDGTYKKYAKTWKDIDKEFKRDHNLGRQIRKTSHVKNLLPIAISGKQNGLEKAKAIFNFVQEQFTLENISGHIDKTSVKNLIQTKTGSSVEINILLHNLLEYHDFASHTVLLSTRKNGFATKVYPQMSDFNYLIVKVIIDGESYLLDATNKYIPFGELPFKCLNQYGRLLDFKKGSKWIDIKAKDISSTQRKMNLKLDADDTSIIGTIENTYQGYHAYVKKKTYFSNNEEYQTKLESRYEDLDISNYSVTSEEKSSRTFTESFDIDFIDLNIVDDKIYLDPILIKFFKTNPFKLQERTYPIDFGYKNSYVNSIQIDLGNTYEIETLPKNGNFRLPENGGMLIYSTKVTDNKLMLFFRLSFNKPLYPALYYEALKELMNTAVNFENKTIIVLKKKS